MIATGLQWASSLLSVSLTQKLQKKMKSPYSVPRQTGKKYRKELIYRSLVQTPMKMRAALETSQVED